MTDEGSSEGFHNREKRDINDDREHEHVHDYDHDHGHEDISNIVDDELNQPIDAAEAEAENEKFNNYNNENSANSQTSDQSVNSNTNVGRGHGSGSGGATGSKKPTYYDRAMYKKRRVIKKVSNRRADDNTTNNDVDQNDNVTDTAQDKAEESKVKAPKIIKPDWMPQEVFEQQQASLELSKKGFDNNETKKNEAAEDDIVMASEDPNIKVQHLKSLNPEAKDEIVRRFYNVQTHNSKKQKRTESKIYKLRSFNNCIKYILIDKYARHGGSVLDLGCGKGGDLAKWDMVGTKNYVGIDLSDQSIKEGIIRYKKSRIRFTAVFATGDAFSVPIPEILKQFPIEEVSNLQFDNVSMQFCMHYAFSNENSVRSMLENVSRSLKLGGMFVGTIPSSDFIKWKIKKLKEGEKKWGNSIYSVTFPEVPPRDGKFDNPFGNVYSYYLVDAVDNVPEYLVPFEKFRSLCEEYNLELRYKKNFFELFNKEIANYFNMLPGPLIQSLRREDGSYGVSGEERDACSFYLAFAFEKTA